MRGMSWEDAHWAQLFALLGFKPGVVSKETVTLSHFLDKCEGIVVNAEAIKALDAAVSTCVHCLASMPPPYMYAAVVSTLLCNSPATARKSHFLAVVVVVVVVVMVVVSTGSW